MFVFSNKNSVNFFKNILVKFIYLLLIIKSLAVKKTLYAFHLGILSFLEQKRLPILPKAQHFSLI